MIKKIVSHFLFSFDTIFAWGMYFLLSIIAQRPVSLICFTLIWVCANIFDIDGIPFKMVRAIWKFLDRDDLREKWWSHWYFGHFLILVPVYAWCVAWTSDRLLPGSLHFMFGLSVLCLLEHLVHDSRQPQGLPWFAPMYWQHFTFVDVLPRKAHQQDIDNRQEELAYAEGRQDIDMRITPPTKLQKIVACAELSVFAIWKLWAMLAFHQSLLS